MDKSISNLQAYRFDVARMLINDAAALQEILAPIFPPIEPGDRCLTPTKYRTPTAQNYQQNVIGARPTVPARVSMSTAEEPSLTLAHQDRVLHLVSDVQPTAFKMPKLDGKGKKTEAKKIRPISFFPATVDIGPLLSPASTISTTSGSSSGSSSEPLGTSSSSSSEGSLATTSSKDRLDDRLTKRRLSSRKVTRKRKKGQRRTKQT